eukprot:7897121-Pyramimonas_sp.AAC.1
MLCPPRAPLGAADSASLSAEARVGVPRKLLCVLLSGSFARPVFPQSVLLTAPIGCCKRQALRQLYWPPITLLYFCCRQVTDEVPQGPACSLERDVVRAGSVFLDRRPAAGLASDRPSPSLR